MKLLITGGAGFIGGNFVRYWVKNHPQDEVVVLDKLTYAGNLASLESVKNSITFIEGDIADEATVRAAMNGCDVVVHFAAETHVDRSIHDPYVFTKSNALGTHVLLEVARQLQISRFHHVSTDEVYGDIPLEETWKFQEHSNYKPSSPYSASKAASDHMVRAYHHTFGLPITISNCSNNFGPYHHPEKFIPRSIIRLLNGQNIRLYSPGNQIRDWLHVEDHCRAIESILQHGRVGETYNVGGMAKGISNLEVAQKILAIMGLPSDRIELVTDRPGHDVKYDVDWSKLNRELGWQPLHSFDEWLVQTVQWYINNPDWWQPLAAESEQFYQQKGEQVLFPAVTNNNLETIPAPLMPEQQLVAAQPQQPEQDYIIETALPGVLIIERPTFSDDRGFFRETFRKLHLEQRLGTTMEFVQANHSRSSKHTLRGIHIAPWHKLINVAAGEVQAVLVDTREGSPTFGQHISIVLSDKYPRSVFIPAGVGNSFLVLSDVADYTYLTTDYWAPNRELNLAWNDPQLNIGWLSQTPNLSDKDQGNPTLTELFPNKLT